MNRTRPLEETGARDREDRASGAPEVGVWSRRLLGRFHVTGVFWYRLFAFGVRVLPRFLIAPAVVFFASVFFVFLGNIRRAIANNLEWVLGPAPGGPFGRAARSYRTLLNLAWCMTETYEGLATEAGVESEYEGLEHWQSVADRKTGFVLVTAHVGHWEISSRAVRIDRPVHVVREQEIDPESQRFFHELLARRSGGRVRFHFTRRDDFALGGRLLSALRRGEIVALQGDRPREGAHAEPVELLGQRLLLPVGPVALASAAGVPLLPVFSLREGRSRSRVVFQPPIEVDRGAGRGERKQAHARALQEIASHVEWAIRSAPFQWFCLRDLWGRPAKRS